MLSEAQRQSLAVQFRAQQLSASSPIGRRPAELTEIPLSFAQEQLWFLDRLAPGLPTYNVPIRLRLQGKLDQVALRSALAAVVARHEALRTRFLEGPQGMPVQVIDEPAEPAMPVVELASADLAGTRQADPESADPVARLAELSAGLAAEPFDLATGPLFRCELIRLAGDDHVLVIVVHHIVFDGWSTNLLVRELAACYTAAVTGNPAELPELGVQFADYALWERQRLATASTELADFWRTTLDGLETLQLPTDQPRPVLESFHGNIRRHHLGAEAAEGVQALSKRQSVTPFVVLLAALQAQLARYTGQRDIVVGIPSANRGRSRLQPLIGFLVNMLPIRADLSGDPSFLELLRRIQRTTVDAYAHQELPLAKIVEAAGVQRDPGRSPIFQVVLSVADSPEQVPAAGLTMLPERIDLAAAKFDLAFFAEFCPDGLWLEVTYASDLFDVETIDRMLVHYGELLRGALAEPTLRLSELPLLSEAEVFAELVEWNPPVAIPADPAMPCIHQLFEAQVRQRPDAPAAVFGTERVSYAELDRMANRLAVWLVGQGVRAETLVGVAMAPSIRRLAVVLGILKAGGGYLPLDPALPKDRLAFMIGDAALRWVVAEPEAGLGTLLASAGVSPLDPGCATLAEPDPAAPAVSVAGDNVAYVIYTSGSTGQPKGVVIEHRSLVHFVLGAIDCWQLRPGDRILQFASLSFDVSAQDMFCSLASGATAVVADDDTRLSPPRLGALMRACRVTFACLQPAVLGLLADQEFPDLRLLEAGGEALPDEIAKAWLRDGLRLVNGYGPTETTIASLCGEVDGHTWPAPIGRPLPNFQAYVLDPDLNPMPVGMVGELYIGGPCVARGYLNRPALTAERFIEDPFNPDPDARLYRTGDLVKRLADGRVTFVGRADGQVKLRGLRIELGEIEAALSRHPAVEQAVVQLEQDAAGAKFIAGYLRLAPAAREPDAAAFTDFLRRWLPGYMIPTRIVWLDSFPLNSSRKVDRKALAASAVATATSRPAAEPQPPGTSTEAKLVDIYCELLGRDRCDVLESFFDAGGNSLQAMQLISRIRAVFGVDLPVTEVFLRPDVRRLAACIDSWRTGEAHQGAGGPLVPLSDGTGVDPLFLVHAVGGTVVPYTPLAVELADRYRVFGIQSPGLAGAALPEATTLAGLAGHYLAELRKIQPAGPYRVGGWSMGGLLAYEIACQLEDAGEVVELLVLLDPPFAIAQTESTEQHLARQFVADAMRTLNAPAGQAESAEDPLACLMSVLDPGADQDTLAEEVRRRLAAFSYHHRLMSGYRPARPVPAAATLLVSAEQSPNAAVQAEWVGIATGDLRVVSYDADHYSLLQLPHVRAVAGCIAAEALT